MSLSQVVAPGAEVTVVEVARVPVGARFGLCAAAGALRDEADAASAQAEDAQRLLASARMRLATAAVLVEESAPSSPAAPQPPAAQQPPPVDLRRGARRRKPRRGGAGGDDDDDEEEASDEALSDEEASTRRVMGEEEAAWRAAACAARSQRRHFLVRSLALSDRHVSLSIACLNCSSNLSQAAFRSWRDVAAAQRALHAAWLRVAQRSVKRLVRALFATNFCTHFFF